MSKQPEKRSVGTTGKPGADFGKVHARANTTEPAPSRIPACNWTYTVVRGDTLSYISKHIYGSANRWPEIFEANRGQVVDPDRIRPGQVLKMPPDDGAATA